MQIPAVAVWEETAADCGSLSFIMDFTLLKEGFES